MSSLKKSERKFFRIRKAIRDKLKAEKLGQGKKKKQTNNKKTRPDLPDSFYDEFEEMDKRNDPKKKTWDQKLGERMERFLSEKACACSRRFTEYFSPALRTEIERQISTVLLDHAKGSLATLEEIAEAYAKCADTQITALVLSKSTAIRKVRFLRMFCETKNASHPAIATTTTTTATTDPLYLKLVQSLLSRLGVKKSGAVALDLLLGLEKRLVDQELSVSARSLQRKQWWVQTKINFLQNPEWVKKVLNGKDAIVWAFKIGKDFTSETYCQYSKQGEQALKAMQDKREEIQNSTDLALLDSHVPAIDGLYTCFKCKGTKTHIYEAQTRSGDEPLTIFIKCIGCGNRWRN